MNGFSLKIPPQHWLKAMPKLTFLRLIAILSFLTFFFLLAKPVTSDHLPDPHSKTRVKTIYVILWFDTEDYILPQSDDAALRVAEILTQQGVRATFKIVGEKARTLEKRGRQDVIAALSRHNIGYHSNLHSQQPSPALRLSNMGWEEGVQEFDRTERVGFDEVHRIFGITPVCYGQPGASWAPQSYLALKRWGVPLYLDEGEHVGIDGQPFWYGGILNVFNMGKNQTRVQLHKAADVDEAKNEFEKIYLRLKNSEGGLVSIYYHPCEFVHQEFWDVVNFAHGANPPAEEWKKPRIKTAQEIEQGYRNFEDYIAYLKSHCDVKFVTGSEVLELYKDDAPRKAFSKKDILKTAGAVQREINYQAWPGFSISPAEIFFLLNSYLAAYLKTQQAPASAGCEFVYGPIRRIETGQQSGSLSWNQLAAACLDVQSALKKNQQIPSEIWVGSHPLSPADYLATLGEAIQQLVTLGKPKMTLSVRHGNFTAEQYVARDCLEIWKWPIFPDGFHSPKIMDLAQLQAWTLKPAVLNK